MRLVRTYTGKLRIIERLPSSANGNPRYLFAIGTRVARTAPDSPYGFTIKNHEGKKVVADIGIYRNKETLDSIELAK